MTNKEFRKNFDINSEPVERSAQQRAIDGLGKMTKKNLEDKKQGNWGHRIFNINTPHVQRDSDGNIIGNDNYYVDRDG